MRMFAMVALALAACGGTPGGGDDGPQPGTWTISHEIPFDGWTFGIDSERCTPPTYFDPPPEQAIISADGAIEWVGVVTHRGDFDGRCLVVPGAEERGVIREPYSLCAEVDGDTMMAIDDRAIVSDLRWNLGRVDQCGGYAEFLLAP